MALVFLSHAHSDEILARKIIALLSDALALSPTDFFVSSQEGRGVAPAASIRGEIMRTLGSAPTLIVLLTPSSAGSPWVWLEAGNRLGSADKPNPLFVVPGDRFVGLLKPVADLRCLRLDNEGELHELVKAVAETLGKPVRGVLDYMPALTELQQRAGVAYSAADARRTRAAAWLRGHWAAILMMAIGLGAGAYGLRPREPVVVTPPAEGDGDLLARNDDFGAVAARYLILRGTVMSGAGPVEGATVMASRLNEVRESAACQEPDCTWVNTRTEGEFLLDLTRIRVDNGDDIVLSVVAPDFRFFSQNVKVDVRAADVRLAPSHMVKLTPQKTSAPPKGPQP
jgi:hypothetical protein